VSKTQTLVQKWNVETAALHKILCYCNVWLSEKDEGDKRSSHNATQFQTCKHETYTSADVNYGTPAAKVACLLTSVANHPGTTGFGTQEFSNFTDFVESVVPCLEATEATNWQLAVRTTGNRHSELGTMDALVVTAEGSGTGIFPPFRSATNIRYIKIRRASDGQEAIYTLASELANNLEATIHGCGEFSNTYTTSPSTTAWTAAYSGQQTSGDLTGFPYMFICGVNTESDDDHSVLAFTDNTGEAGNGWGDAWRRDNQRGTLWSLFNDDFKAGHHNSRGWSYNQGFPGYKGTNAGTFEVYLKAR